MDKLRRYGDGPYNVALVHGGPGAAGEVAPVARILSGRSGVLEPLQTAVSLDGQVEELRAQLEGNADKPLALVGYSWGAWLALLTAARYPALADKLILVSSGPFEAAYAEAIMPARLARLPADERAELSALFSSFENGIGADSALARIGALCEKADAYSSLPPDIEPYPLPCRAEVFSNVWAEAAQLRHSGELLAIAGRVRCPVVGIHGEHDPHPAEGVRKPLAGVLKDFRFIVLPKCGHKPWREKEASAVFYETLFAELPVRAGK